MNRTLAAAVLLAMCGLLLGIAGLVDSADHVDEHDVEDLCLTIVVLMADVPPPVLGAAEPVCAEVDG